MVCVYNKCLENKAREVNYELSVITFINISKFSHQIIFLEWKKENYFKNRVKEVVLYHLLFMVADDVVVEAAANLRFEVNHLVTVLSSSLYWLFNRSAVETEFF